MIARTTLTTLTTLSLLAVLAGCESTRPPAPIVAPTAEEILEGYVEATGGRAAHQAVTSTRIRFTIGSERLGVAARGEMVERAPNLTHVRMKGPGGTTERGCDGTTVWEISDIAGARIVTGVERDEDLRGDARIDTHVRWRELHTRVELAGPAEYRGRPAWKVLLTTPEGKVDTDYYDRETRLKLGWEHVRSRQTGEKKTCLRVVEYATFGALKMAKSVEECDNEQDVRIVLESVELNPTLPPDAFRLPPEVVALRDQQASP